MDVNTPFVFYHTRRQLLQPHEYLHQLVVSWMILISIIVIGPRLSRIKRKFKTVYKMWNCDYVFSYYCNTISYLNQTSFFFNYTLNYFFIVNYLPMN